MPTSIQVEHSTWKRLNGLKEPGESFDDVVNRVIDQADNGTERGNNG